jgi:hypothetical protein
MAKRAPFFKLGAENKCKIEGNAGWSTEEGNVAVQKKAQPKKKAAPVPKAKPRVKVKTSSAQRKAMAQADKFRQGLLPLATAGSIRAQNVKAKSNLPHGVRPSGRKQAPRWDTPPR